VAETSQTKVRGFKPTGPHQQNRLSAVFVRSAPPGRHFDGNGLFLYVEKNGTRRWYQRLTIHGRRREAGLGAPPVVTLADARNQAIDNLRAVREGRDPIAEQRASRAEIASAIRVPTFAEAVEGCMEKKAPEFTSEKHENQWRSTLDNYAVPVIGKLPVDKIDANDILAILKPIWMDKTETAKRLRQRIEAVLRWATVSGYRDGENPARWKDNLAERLPSPGKVAMTIHQPALSLADAAEWFAKLKERDGNGARALEFLTLTAARSGEVRGMTWAEVDLDNAVWIVPAKRMKMKREHRVPLTEPAITLLRALPHNASSPYVFFASRGGMLSDMSVSAVMRRMHDAEIRAGGLGFLDQLSQRPAVPHGLRSTFRDWVSEQTSYPGELAEIALAHKVSNSVEAAYRRGDQLEKRRQMMAAWAQFLRGENRIVVPVEFGHG